MIVYFIAYCPLIGYSGIGIKAKCDSDRAILSLLSLFKNEMIIKNFLCEMTDRWLWKDCERNELKDCLFIYHFLNFGINRKGLGDDSKMSWSDDNEMTVRLLWNEY